MASITRPVGRLVPGSMGNLANDARTVQQLLNNHMSRLSPLSPLRVDGLVGPKTIQAIERFQQTVVRMPRPDGRVDPGGGTIRALSQPAGAPVPTPTPTPTPGGSQFYFPFSSLPSASWTDGMRRFGANRSNGTRAHAGCDLYYPNGTWIHAITNGTVVNGPYAFYAGTYAIEVDHGSFLARYGEIQAQANVSTGSPVTAGQRIAKVGHLVGINVPSDMLHLELYSNSGSGPLTVSAAAGKKRADGIPFNRRSDLLDPTTYLNTWQSNLAPG